MADLGAITKSSIGGTHSMPDTHATSGAQAHSSNGGTYSVSETHATSDAKAVWSRVRKSVILQSTGGVRG